MKKTFKNLRSSLAEWSAPTAHTARVTQSLSVSTGKSSTAKRPSVIQPTKIMMNKSEKKRRGIHFFQLGDTK
jgi:hypothetical protein